MKVLVSLALMCPLLCQAALTIPTTIVSSSASNLKTYVCSKYTDNVVDPKIASAEGFMTDNPVQDSETRIVRTKDGYTVKAGSIFNQDRVLTNPTMDDLGGFAGDKQTMVFKKENESGNPYFLIYITPEEDNPKKSLKEQTRDNPITRLITVAACYTE